MAPPSNGSAFQHGPKQPYKAAYEKVLIESYRLVGVGPRFRRCIRCWAIKDEEHRCDWLNCQGWCQACDEKRQHVGQPCPIMLGRMNGEWWKAHAGIEKPQYHPEPRTGILPPADVAGKEGNGHGGSLASDTDAANDRANYRAEGDRQRSRSPPHDRATEYRDRTLAAAPNGPRNPGRRAPTLNQRERPIVHPTPFPPTPAYASSGTQTTAPANPSHPQQPDILSHPMIQMLIQQSILLSDFLTRHPQVTKGEQVVSDGMQLYLRQIRASNPEYMSPHNPALRQILERSENEGLRESGAGGRGGAREDILGGVVVDGAPVVNNGAGGNGDRSDALTVGGVEESGGRNGEDWVGSEEVGFKEGMDKGAVEDQEMHD